MKINIISSEYLQREIFANNFNSVNKFEEKFLKKYSLEFIKELVSEIPNITGINWKINEINIYFFNANSVNISYPILVNTSTKNNEIVLFNIIHEIIHNNIANLWIFENDKQLNYDPIEAEAIVNLIASILLEKKFTKNILKKVINHKNGGGAKHSYKYVWKRVNKLRNEFDESINNTLINYIKNKKRYKLE